MVTNHWANYHLNFNCNPYKEEIDWKSRINRKRKINYKNRKILANILEDNKILVLKAAEFDIWPKD